METLSILVTYLANCWSALCIFVVPGLMILGSYMILKKISF